jgi:hypothetical protein
MKSMLKDKFKLGFISGSIAGGIVVFILCWSGPVRHQKTIIEAYETLASCKQDIKTDVCVR